MDPFGLPIDPEDSLDFALRVHLDRSNEGLPPLLLELVSYDPKEEALTIHVGDIPPVTVRPSSPKDIPLCPFTTRRTLLRALFDVWRARPSGGYNQGRTVTPKTEKRSP